MKCFCCLQRTLDHVIHVVILILRQPPAEDGIGLLLSQGCVLLVEALVSLIIDGIIGFFARMPVGGVFAGDVGDGLGAELEVLVLDDASVRDLALGVVDDGDALMVLFLEAFGLKAQAAVFELAELVAEVLVD